MIQILNVSGEVREIANACNAETLKALYCVLGVGYGPPLPGHPLRRSTDVLLDSDKTPPDPTD